MLEHYVEDDVEILRFNHPPTNSITLEMLASLDGLVSEANETAGIKGIILTGGGRFFSSGFDLPLFINFEDISAAERFFTYEESVLLSLFTCSKPVISAINGHAVAAGLIYSMAADYRIAVESPTIKIGMSEIKIGLPLLFAQHEVMRFGLDSNIKFRDVIFSGEMMTVQKAREMAVVDEVVSEDALLDRSKQIISMCMDTPNQPFLRMKELLRMDTARRIQQKIRDEDWREGLQGFFRKDVQKTLESVQAGMK